MLLICVRRSNRRQANVDCAAPSNGRFADCTDIINIDYDTSLIHILFCINIFCEIYAPIASRTGANTVKWSFLMRRTVSNAARTFERKPVSLFNQVFILFIWEELYFFLYLTKLWCIEEKYARFYALLVELAFIYNSKHNKKQATEISSHFADNTKLALSIRVNVFVKGARY